jgi:hypothetical protein
MMALSKSPDLIKVLAVSCRVLGSSGCAITVKETNKTVRREKNIFIVCKLKNRDVIRSVFVAK